MIYLYIDLESKLKYKLLAFITLCKKQRRNSVVIYKNESIANRAKAMGIGYYTFKKYLDICIKNKLITETTTGHYILVKMRDILVFMNDGVVTAKNLTFNRFVLFFNYHEYETITFKEIHEQIRKSIILKNYKQQQFRIDQTQHLVKFYFNKDYRTQRAKQEVYNTYISIVKQARKEYMTSEEYIKSLSKKSRKYIVSGKYHVAGLIEMSPSTGQRLLKQLSKKEIKREVQTQDITNTYNSKTFDFYSDYFRKSKFRVVPTRTKLLLFKGSRITLNSPSLPLS